MARAFDRLRRADWPTTLAQLPTVGVRAALVLATATRMAICDARGVIETPPPPAPTSNPTRRAAPVQKPARPPARPVIFDRKRLAAGEREDD